MRSRLQPATAPLATEPSSLLPRGRSPAGEGSGRHAKGSAARCPATPTRRARLRRRRTLAAGHCQPLRSFRSASRASAGNERAPKKTIRETSTLPPQPHFERNIITNGVLAAAGSATGTPPSQAQLAGHTTRGRSPRWPCRRRAFPCGGAPAVPAVSLSRRRSMLGRRWRGRMGVEPTGEARNLLTGQVKSLARSSNRCSRPRRPRSGHGHSW